MTDTHTTAHIPDEAVQAAEAQFTEYFLKNYPKDCIIYNPAWHAPKIFRAAKAAIIENLPHLSAPCAVDVDALANEIRRVNGSNNLGAGALAEALVPFLYQIVTKPVDVATVRRQALEEAAKALDAWGDIYGSNAASCVRALSAEPARGEQWQPIETAPNSEMLLLACADWPLVKCGREVPVKVGHKSFGRWTVFGASWTPTHWMPLPAAPNTEAGK